MVADFLDDTFQDIYEMQTMESGWCFDRVVYFDVRHLKRNAHNEVFTIGHRNEKKRIEFHEDVRLLFSRVVLDPVKYLEVGFPATHLCLPACILICIRAKLKQTLRSLSKKQMTAELAVLPWQNFICPGTDGIPLESVSNFEKLLTPIPKELIRLYPSLSVFSGIAINIFAIRKKKEVRRLFPLSLSKNNRNQSFFQADALIESPELFQPPYLPPKNHCLAVTNLPVLLTRFSGRRSNYNKYRFLCRSCGFTAMTNERLEEHFNICQERIRGPLGRRKCQNRLVHRPYLVNRFTNKTERNGIYFKRGDSYKLLKNTVLCFLDFESFNKRYEDSSAKESSSMFEKVPKNAVTSQPVCSYSYVITSLHEDLHPLPPNLSQPRFKRINDANIDRRASERDFFLALLLSLRYDLLLHYLFLQKIIDENTPAPAPSFRSEDEMNFMASVKSCMICGSIFGRKKVSPKSQKYHIVKRTYDHDHFNISKGLRLVLCQVTPCVSLFLT